MSFEDYFNTIVNSRRGDWNVIVCWGYGSGPSYRDQLIVWNTGSDEFHNLEVRSHSYVAVFKPDLSISLAFGLPANEEFEEPWSSGFPDPRASSHYVDFLYGQSLVHRDLYISVDGGRADLPLPRVVYAKASDERNRYLIAERQDLFFRLFNQFEMEKEYDSYRDRAGFEVAPRQWPGHHA